MPKEETGQDKKLKITVEIFTILASIFIIIGAIVTVYSHLPEWLIWLTFIFITTVILWLLSNSISNFIKKKAEVQKQNILAKKYFDEFKNFTDRFDEFMGTRYDVIPYLLQKLANSVTTEVIGGVDKRKYKEIPILPVEPFNNLSINLKMRLQRFNGTKDDFFLLITEFDAMLSLYSKFHICKPVEKIREIGSNEVPKDMKEDYNKYKRKYERFVEDYTNFGKKVNKEFSEKICTEFVDLPKEL